MTLFSFFHFSSLVVFLVVLELELVLVSDHTSAV